MDFNNTAASTQVHALDNNTQEPQTVWTPIDIGEVRYLVDEISNLTSHHLILTMEHSDADSEQAQPIEPEFQVWPAGGRQRSWRQMRMAMGNQGRPSGPESGYRQAPHREGQHEVGDLAESVITEQTHAPVGWGSGGRGKCAERGQRMKMSP